MQFEVTELVEMLGRRIEIIQRPLQEADFTNADPAVGSMDDSIKSVDGFLEAVRHARPGEIHLWVRRASRANNEQPIEFVIFNDSNLFYELTIYNEGSTQWKHQTT